jgi:polyisoprenoid-binding protein YceI
MTRNVMTQAAAPAANTRALETFVVDPDHSEVGFSVRHLLSRTRGRFGRFRGLVNLDRQQPERSSVTFTVEAASIDTRQNDRDAHLRSGDFFDAASHPDITFASTRILRLSDDRYDVIGQFTLRGITRELTLPVTFHGVARDPWGGERAGFSTEIELNRKEFGMVWNAALDNGGFVLGDEVRVTIDLETLRQAQATAA